MATALLLFGAASLTAAAASDAPRLRLTDAACASLAATVGCDANLSPGLAVRQGCAAQCAGLPLRRLEEPEVPQYPSGPYCCRPEEAPEGPAARRRLEEPEIPACAFEEDTKVSELQLVIPANSLEDEEDVAVDISYTVEGNTTHCTDQKIRWDAEQNSVIFESEDNCNGEELSKTIGSPAIWDAQLDSLTISLKGKEVKLAHCPSEDELRTQDRVKAFMVLVILAVLVVVSIFFEWATEVFQDFLEEQMPESVPVLKTIMKELTILGFLGLCTFLVNRYGGLKRVGASFFGHGAEEAEVLPENFELIHMSLFFVMALFLAMGGVLVIMLEVHEKRLRFYGKLAQEQPAQLLSEYLTRCLGYTERGLPSAAGAQPEKSQIVSSEGRYGIRWLLGLHKNITSKGELKEAMMFYAMRVRFIRTFGNQGGELKGENLEVGDDFDFAEYLANAQAETAEDLIELTRGTWVMLGVFFVVVYAFMVTRNALLQLIVFIGFGYLTLLISLLLDRWLSDMQDKLTLPIEGAEGNVFLKRQYQEALGREGTEDGGLSSPGAVVATNVGSIQGDPAESQPLLGGDDGHMIEPPYTKLALSPDMKQFMRDISDPNGCCTGKSCRKHGLPNKHRLLFGRCLARFGQGPHFVLFLIRLVMMLSAIYLVILVNFMEETITKVLTESLDSHIPEWVVYVVAIIPCPFGMFAFPFDLIAKWCAVCKIEQMCDEENVKNVLQTMRDRRVVAAIKMIGAMGEARRIEMAGKEETQVLTVPVPTTPLEKTLAAERKRNNRMMFDTFDSSEDGQLDKEEFRRLMEAVGTYIEEDALERMITEIELMTGGGDAGDGEISFEEFNNYMEARAAAGESSEERTAFLFSLFDQDGDGDISTDEFITKMKEVCTTLTDAELAAVCRDCDKDHDGGITMSEFVEWVEKYSDMEE